MKTKLTNVLAQEMNRKEFLRYMGVAVLMLVGGGAILQALGALQSPKRSSGNTSYGYGSSSYGGLRR